MIKKYLQDCPREIFEKILEYCSFEIIKTTRSVQSKYLRDKTKYFSYSDIFYKHKTYENYQQIINNLAWLKSRTPEYIDIDNAFKIGNLNVIKYLMNDDPSTDLNEALLLCAEYGHLDVIKYLVNIEGANIHIYNDMVLNISANNGHLDIVKYLFDNGC